MHFEPDFRHMLAVMHNERPARLPIYEHHISPVIMEQVLDVRMVELLSGDDDDLDEYYRLFCHFSRR